MNMDRNQAVNFLQWGKKTKKKKKKNSNKHRKCYCIPADFVALWITCFKEKEEKKREKKKIRDKANKLKKKK